MENFIESSPKTIEYIVFKLEKEYYCVEIQQVERILPHTSSIRKVPKLPECIKGIIDFEEKIVPVIDVKIKLGIQETFNVNEGSFIILFEVKEHLMGIIVDTIYELKEVFPLQKKETAIPQHIKEYSDGSVRMQDKEFQKNANEGEELVVILNPSKLYALIEKELMEYGN